MPLAEQSSGLGTRLRLCNKLTELMLDLKMFGDAVEFAHVALDISITLGKFVICFSGFMFHLALQATAAHLKRVLLEVVATILSDTAELHHLQRSSV